MSVDDWFVISTLNVAVLGVTPFPLKFNTPEGTVEVIAGVGRMFTYGKEPEGVTLSVLSTFKLK
jgi:hypothetical protein